MARIEQCANAFVADWKNRTPYRTFSTDLAPRDIAESYAVQKLAQEKLEPVRGRLAGRKIALSAKTMQRMCGIDHPISGGIYQSDVHQSGAKIAARSFQHLGIEFELALKLGRDILPDAPPHTPASVVELIEAAHPAFELIEDRNADYSDLDVLTLISDNAWCGGVVLGGQITNWQALDLADIPTSVIQEGNDSEVTNTGAAEPLKSLAWVLNHFGERGITVRAGEFIITGSAARTRFPVVGDRLEYRIADASVQIEIV